VVGSVVRVLVVNLDDGGGGGDDGDDSDDADDAGYGGCKSYSCVSSVLHLIVYIATVHHSFCVIIPVRTYRW
jgi:hypothetical protein